MRLKKRLTSALSGRKGIAILAILVGWAAMDLGSESLILTTSYPSPAGIYRNLTTTQGTVLARDSGDVVLAQGGGNVGIGLTSPPSAKLDVGGDLRVAGNFFAAKDNQGSSKRICTGSSAPTEWKECPPSLCDPVSAIYVDVDTSGCGFTSAPRYLTSISGEGGCTYATTGAAAPYFPKKDSFRIYLFMPEILWSSNDPPYVAGDDRNNCYPLWKNGNRTSWAVENEWRIEWVAFGD